MARDPEVQHDPAQLCEGIRCVRDGGDLTDVPALREELLFIGLLVADHAGGLHVTREGHRFIEADVRPA